MVYTEGMTRTCEKCGQSFVPRQKSRPNRFCSMACYNASGRPIRKELTAGARMRRVPGHPLAPPSGVVAVHRLVLFDKIGPGPHPCEWCGIPVDWMPGEWTNPGALVADHLDWDTHNNDPANLVPSCRVCNAHRVEGGGREPIADSELFVVNSNGSRTRATRRPCEECGTEFVVRVSQVRAGKGRFCSRSCARKQPRTS